MATKLERTSFNVSQTLKTAMVNKGIYPSYQSSQTVYDGAANDMHLLVEQMQDGSYRTINIVNNITSFDIIDINDEQLTRFYNERELGIVISRIEGVSSSEGSFNGTQWEWIITYDNKTYNGTDNSKPNAIAKALIKVINNLPIGFRFR